MKMGIIMKSTVVAFVIINMCYATMSTEIKPCPKKQKYVPISANINDCNTPPCKLKEKTNATITVVFKPETDTEVVLNNVGARIAGILAPFPGVNGTSACNKIYLSDGVTPASCPLKAGQEYTFKNSFPILEIYPKISLVVHWGLKDKDTKKDITCFEVAAKITK